MINIAIVEDEREYRESFKEYFTKVSGSFQCVFAVDSVEKFHKYYNDSLELDIVLLDIRLPGLSGIKAIPSILKIQRKMEIIMFTGMNDADSIFQAITAGASGYLLKNMTYSEVERELLNTMKNGAAISPEIARKIIKHFQPSSITSFLDSPEKKLTEKEMQIVKLLIDGKTYTEIAPLLGLSVNGIKYHVKSIYRKLQIKSKGQLIKTFLNNNF